MAKKKVVSSALTGVDPASALRDVLAAATGARSAADLSSHRSFIGVPIPSIALQWVLNTNVLPLSRMLEFGGAPECCKSTFLYEVIRWFTDAGGHAVLFETEAKDNSQLRHGVLRNDPDRIGRVSVVSVTQYETWTEGVKSAAKFYSDWQEANELEFPVLFCVDSLVAAPQAKRIAEMQEQGHTSVGYSGIAKALSQDLQTFASFQSGHPFMFAFTNHIKQAMTAMGLPSEYRSGGRAPEFFETASLKFAPAARETRFTRSNCEGRRLRLTTSKNSMGPTKREIEFVLYFLNQENPAFDPTDALSDRYILEVLFDWGETDIKFLLSVLDGKRSEFNTERRRRLSELLDIHVVSKANSATWMWSHTLGIPESDPVSFSEGGKRIFEKEDILRRVQEELYIQRRPAFLAGMNYMQTLEQFTRDSEARAAAQNAVVKAQPNN